MKRNKFKLIGLTGGIATGKSTVSKIIREKGYPVIDADSVAREVVEINKPAYKDIVETFGTEVLKEDKSIDREMLGDIIFKDQEYRSKLNSIVHPRVYQRIKEYINEFENKGYELIFIDIPLLIEVKDKIKKEGIYFDEIWLIYADEETQLKRLIERDKFDREEATIRINSQIPIDEKRKYCDTIIDNTNDIKDTIKQVENEIRRV
ncbi:dephospho-CoA kinase [Clostridium sp. D2Q-11]|uniref:Dephospho-CoA kinase n=1 Tax=Anaeromonas frigoriresistens TaxID=2683708 RepID=A0A942Z7Q5_9FIRM|nr:dephospho-CoA kinase [Anaeromonas frigoriresistens]MBS4537200.1 dephospho-CoA kinase [Anaeromonas frigoriresistens]